ncbi:MAG: reverse transcriptase domain-containing protein [Sedimenticola sp.]
MNATQSNDSLLDICSDNTLPEHLNELYANSSRQLGSEEQIRLKHLLIKYQKQFSKDSHDLGRYTSLEHHIDVIPGTRPSKQQPYRLPLAKRRDAEAEISAMAERDLIEPSTSPWSSPAIIVPKKNGGIRFCIDYRRLNKVTIPDSMPLPRCDDSLEALGGSKWFSTLDLRSGFFQVGLDEESRPLTAFCIPGSGLWQFKVVPFGSMTSPACFERVMEKVFAGLTFVSLLIYLDDIIVFGKTFDIHLHHLEEVFKRLAQANLKLNPEKCQFFQAEVTFLGHLVSETGIAVDPAKTKTVRNWPIPRNVSELRSFVGLCSYMRKFIEGFSSICKPLHVLTQKDQKFIWTQECEQAFERLKVALTSTPVLAFPQESQGTFIVDADASNDALGSVLSQEQDGQERVIGYYSKCFNKAERRYCTTRKELLAVVSSIKHFHHYLYGRHFKVRSDHGSLRWLMNFKICEGALARILETLAIYDYTIEHRPGVRHQNADSLSRRPCSERECAHCERFEKRYSETEPGLATRNIGVRSEESAKQGESLVQVDMSSCIEECQNDSCLSKDSSCKISVCTEEGPLRTHCSARDAECSITGGIRKGTTPTPEGPMEECESLFQNQGIPPSPGINEKQDQILGCDTIRDLGVTRVKQLEPRTRVDTQLSCYSTVTETTVGGTLSKQESQDTSPLYCTMDSDSSDYDVEEDRRNSDVGVDESGYTANVRNLDCTNIDCLSPENIKCEQDQQPEIKMIKEWKCDGNRPKWSQIAQYGCELKAYWSAWDSLVLIDEMLYKKKATDEPIQKSPRVVLPTVLRKKCFNLLHDSVTSAHLGSQKTLEKIKQRFYWYNCRKDVEHWCRTCDICASRKPPYRRAKAPMKQYNVGYPLERIAIDIMGPLPNSDNARYLLLVSCYFTKWLMAIPLEKIDAKTVATKLIERFVSVFGIPVTLHSDQGSNFESSVFREVCTILGIEKTRTTPGRPQSDGMVERACRSVQAMLSAYVKQNQKDWSIYIPLLILAYNSSVHDTTRCTPASLMLGRQLRLPIDLALGIPETRPSTCETDYAYMLEKQLIHMHDIARKHIQISSDGMKRYYDRNTHFKEHYVGDAVWYLYVERKPGISPKLTRNWKGPYIITDKFGDVLYRIQKCPRGKSKLVHYDKLKCYLGENKPTWFNTTK